MVKRKRSGVRVMPMANSKSKDIVNQAMTKASKTGLSGLMGTKSKYNMFGKRQKR